MAEADFWPSFNLEPRTPIEMLEEQADILTARTGGRLKGFVDGALIDEGMRLEFIVEAPTLDYRHILFKVEHGADLAYPATVIAEPVAKVVREEEEDVDVYGNRFVEEESVHEGSSAGPLGFPGRGPRTTRIKRYVKRLQYPNATSESEFAGYLRTVLRAPSTQAVINSLLARIRLPSPSDEFDTGT